MTFGIHLKRVPPLGRLELEVLQYVWRVGAGDAKGVQQELHLQRAISLSTVQSTLDRLYRKQLLARGKVRHAYVYTPAVTRQDLITRMVADVIGRLGGGNLNQALSGLIDLADSADESTLSRLESMIAQRRNKAAQEN